MLTYLKLARYNPHDAVFHGAFQSGNSENGNEGLTDLNQLLMLEYFYVLSVKKS